MSYDLKKGDALAQMKINIRLHRHILKNAGTVSPLAVIASEAALDADTFLYLRVHADMSFTNTRPQNKWAFGTDWSSVRGDPEP